MKKITLKQAGDHYSTYLAANPIKATNKALHWFYYIEWLGKQ